MNIGIKSFTKFSFIRDELLSGLENEVDRIEGHQWSSIDRINWMKNFKKGVLCKNNIKEGMKD